MTVEDSYPMDTRCDVCDELWAVHAGFMCRKGGGRFRPAELSLIRAERDALRAALDKAITDGANPYALAYQYVCDEHDTLRDQHNQVLSEYEAELKARLQLEAERDALRAALEDRIEKELTELNECGFVIQQDGATVVVRLSDAKHALLAVRAVTRQEPPR